MSDSTIKTASHDGDIVGKFIGCMDWNDLCATTKWDFPEPADLHFAYLLEETDYTWVMAVWRDGHRWFFENNVYVENEDDSDHDPPEPLDILTAYLSVHRIAFENRIFSEGLSHSGRSKDNRLLTACIATIEVMKPYLAQAGISLAYGVQRSVGQWEDRFESIDAVYDCLNIAIRHVHAAETQEVANMLRHEKERALHEEGRILRKASEISDQEESVGEEDDDDEHDLESTSSSYLEEADFSVVVIVKRSNLPENLAPYDKADAINEGHPFQG